MASGSAGAAGTANGAGAGGTQSAGGAGGVGDEGGTGAIFNGGTGGSYATCASGGFTNTSGWATGGYGGCDTGKAGGGGGGGADSVRIASPTHALTHARNGTPGTTTQRTHDHMQFLAGGYYGGGGGADFNVREWRSSIAT
jgi:hypothetical protein